MDVVRKYLSSSILVKLFGFRAMLIHGDPMVIDRWNWLKAKLPKTDSSLKILDVGCGPGAFTIGLALRGYDSLGLNWNESELKKAIERAAICGANNAHFNKQDIRFLNEKEDLTGNFDIVICLETAEHILDDQKLMNRISSCLKLKGKLFFTAPNFNYIPIWTGYGKKIIPPKLEDGKHVRVGYTKNDLEKLCANSGLTVNEISYCSGFLSQKISGLMALIGKVHPLSGWLITLPLRPFAVMFDNLFTKILKYDWYSICLVAEKTE